MHLRRSRSWASEHRSCTWIRHINSVSILHINSVHWSYTSNPYIDLQPYIKIVAHKLWPITAAQWRQGYGLSNGPIDIGDYKLLDTNSVRQWPVSERMIAGFGRWISETESVRLNRWLWISESNVKREASKGRLIVPSRCSLDTL